MNTAQDYKAEAIRYWEIRRIIWNILLVPPAVLSYMLGSGVAAGIGDPAEFGRSVAIASFCFAAVGANICYSFAYVVEFWIQGAKSENSYREYGRATLFGLGCFLGIGLSVVGAASIVQAQYPV